MSLPTFASDALAQAQQLAAAAVAIVAGAAAITPPALPAPPTWSILDVPFLAIPLGVLAASLAGAAARTFRDEAEPDWKIASRITHIVIDGFIGGWIAVGLVTFKYTKPIFDGVSPAIVGAFAGLGVQYLSAKVPEWIDLIVKAWIAIFSRRGNNKGSETP